MNFLPPRACPSPWKTAYAKRSDATHALDMIRARSHGRRIECFVYRCACGAFHVTSNDTETTARQRANGDRYHKKKRGKRRNRRRALTLRALDFGSAQVRY